MYFTQITQQAIILYNEIQQNELGYKQQLYKIRIYPAFRKIAIAMVTRYKIQQRIQKAESMIYDTIAKMTNNMIHIKLQKGRAFSYFTVVARNYVLSQLDRGIKYNQRHTSINQLNSQNVQINLAQTSSRQTWQNQQQRQFNRLLYTKLFKQLEDQILFMIQVKDIRKQQDVKIAHAVIRLMGDIEYLDNLDRKAVMLYLSQMTGYQNSQINKVLSMIRRRYQNLKQYVLTNDLQLLTFYNMEWVK